MFYIIDWEYYSCRLEKFVLGSNLNKILNWWDFFSILNFIRLFLYEDELFKVLWEIYGLGIENI